MHPTMAAGPTRALVEAEELWLLELEPDEDEEELIALCEGVELELEEPEALEDWLAEDEVLALAEEEVGETETEAIEPEAEADEEEDPELEEAETAPETILPSPQGIAGPSGCLA